MGPAPDKAVVSPWVAANPGVPALASIACAKRANRERFGRARLAYEEHSPSRPARGKRLRRRASAVPLAFAAFRPGYICADLPKLNPNHSHRHCPLHGEKRFADRARRVLPDVRGQSNAPCAPTTRPRQPFARRHRPGVQKQAVLAAKAREIVEPSRRSSRIRGSGPRNLKTAGDPAPVLDGAVRWSLRPGRRGNAS